MHRSLNVIRGCLRFSCRTRWLSVLSAIFLTLLASQELLAQQNRAPFLEPVTRHELVIGEILDLVVRPFDPDGVVPSLNLLEAPSGTTLTDAGNGARRLQWRPDSSQTGNTVIVLQAVDGADPSLRANQRLEITVRAASSGSAALVPSQTQPVAGFVATPGAGSDRLRFDPQTPLSDRSVNVGETLSVVVRAFSDNGVPGLALRSAPAGSRFTDNGDGTRTFSWTPSGGEQGVRQVVIEAQHPSDGSLRLTQEFSINIGGPATLNLSPQPSSPGPVAVFSDNRPVIQPLADVSVAAGGAVIFRVTPIDPDGTPATLTVDPMPEGSTFNDNRDGTRTFFWQTRDSDSGQHRLTFTAVDGNDPSLSHSESLLINVGNVQANAGQVVLPLPESGTGAQPNVPDSNAPLSFAALPSVQVPANTPISQTIRVRVAAGRPVPSLLVLNAPQGSNFSDNGDGSRQFNWTPSESDVGSHTINFQAIDGADQSITAGLSLSIQVVSPDISLNEIFSGSGSTNTSVIGIQSISEQLGRPNQDIIFRVVPIHEGRPVPSLLLRNAPSGASLSDNGDGSRLFTWRPTNEHVGVFTPEIVAIATLDSNLIAVQPLRLVITNDIAGTTAIVSAGTSPLQPQTRADAALFLIRSTFGPRSQDIDRLMNIPYEQWINDQLNLPMTGHRDRLDVFLRDRGLFNISTGDRQLERSQIRSDAFWDVIVNAQDQLRQRVAFALSQILVISDSDLALENRVRGFAHYHDILLRHAFGSYRQLLTEVSLNPMMGDFLSARRNERADPFSNIQPDENYARELMQLFTIGLDQLDINGTRRRDSEGRRLLAYNQNDVMNLARVFTGWNYGDAREMRDDRRTLDSEILPMRAFEEFHDRDPKRLLGTIDIPGGGSARADLDRALDGLFQHPNMPPFISRQLIQRLVTSNPTPAYIERVARVFINDGSGSRGNLGAVVRAILLDPEAFNGHRVDPFQFGKLKEPILKITALWRAFNARGRFNRFRYADPIRDFAQEAYGAPSVFNFYSPDHRPPGAVSDRGLVSPEAQIVNENTVLRGSNRLFDFVFEVPLGNDEFFANQHQIVLDIGPQRALANDPAALVENINELMMAGQMSDNMRNVVRQLVENTPLDDNGSNRVREALYLIIASPEFAVQR